MRFRAALILLPLAAFAQEPPPEVDQALRARVTEFFQYHVDGEFRKAYNLVAEDTKDFYFAAQKIQFKSFKIDNIKYTDEFSKATVTLTCQQMMRMRLEFAETLLTVPMVTEWKIENGKWVWYRDPKAGWNTPMGPSDPDAVKKGAGTVPKPDLSPDAMARAASQILKQSKFDKDQVVIAAGKGSVGETTFHNGQPGQVEIALIAVTLPPGLTVKLEKTTLNASEDTVLKVEYKPVAGAEKPEDVRLQLVMKPFNQVFPLTIHFE